MTGSKLHFRSIAIGLGVAVALLAGLSALLPLPLLVLSRIDIDWNRLSVIGQSYTAGATLLSAVALIGVALSLRLQVKQNAIVQGQAVRQFQNDLLQLGMSDPLYSSLLPPDLGASHDEIRRVLYVTQWARYFEFLFLSDELPEDALAAEFRDIFEVDANRKWWETVGPGWTSRISVMGSSRRRFTQIVQEEYDRSRPPPPP